MFNFIYKTTINDFHIQHVTRKNAYCKLLCIFLLNCLDAILVISLKVNVIITINTHRLYTRLAGMYDNLYHWTLTSPSIIFIHFLLYQVEILNCNSFQSNSNFHADSCELLLYIFYQHSLFHSFFHLYHCYLNHSVFLHFSVHF